MSGPPPRHAPGRPPGYPRGRGLARLVLGAGLGLALVWSLGLGWFLHLAARQGTRVAQADGIVALTGGPERVEIALRLLEAGAAGRLLVSGTGERTDLAALAHRAGIDPAPLADRITLGRAARSTRGNALETQAWARERRINSILLVTAWFHMPRALAELRRTLPGETVLPWPVGRLSLEELARDGMARRIIGEYHKYLASAAGLSTWPFARTPRDMGPGGGPGVGPGMEPAG